MQKVMIPGSTLSVSRFIFGTSDLFNAGSQPRRRTLLEAAVDYGFTHFDTAPYYGFGMAERDLQAVLAHHPHVTVTTKVGLYAPGGEDQHAVSIVARKAGARVFPKLSRVLVDWAVGRARLSLEGSLRRLGRDHIDLLLLHEPVRERLDTDEWRRWLETEVAAGRIGQFGLALDTRHLATFAPMTDALCPVIQTEDSLAGQQADLLLQYGRPLQITYGYVSHARQQEGALNAEDVLVSALERNTSGAIIVSTKRIDRLGQYASVVGRRR